MKKNIITRILGAGLMCSVFSFGAYAETDAEIELNAALSKARLQCAGISGDLEPLKKMAGISTIVNAAGTAVGAGGVATGVAKWYTDRDIALTMQDRDYYKQLLANMENSQANKAALTNWKNNVFTKQDWSNIEEKLKQEMQKYEAASSNDKQDAKKLAQSQIAADEQRITDKQKTSDTLGAVRTGLFATNTATNVAGAVLSSKTGLDKTLEEKINACIISIKQLDAASTRARLEDGDSANYDLIARANNIVNKCKLYENVDSSALNKMAKGGLIAGSVGAATGVAATVTSVIGTNNKISAIDPAQENAGATMRSQNATNVASNVLGGAAAASSLAGTIFNAKQKSKVKEVITISTECEGAL